MVEGGAQAAAMVTFVVVLALVALLTVRGQQLGRITAFVQNPDGILLADTQVSFTCQAMMSNNIYWMVDGVRSNDTTANSGFQILTNLSSMVSVFSTRAKSDGNNTNVTCVVADAQNFVSDSRTGFIVLAAAPLAPILRLTLFSNGSGLRAEWEQPFTMSGFPITSYTLDIVNKTNGRPNKVILDQNLFMTNYDFLSASVPTSCHSLSFSMIATNIVGDSSQSNVVTTGFPIFPRTTNVVLHVELLSASLLTLTFQSPEVCTFQEPPMYSIGIFDSNGTEVALTKTKPVNSSFIVERISAVLERGVSYSAELTILHQNVPGEAFITFIGIDPARYNTPSPVTTTEKNTASSSTPPIEKLLLITTLILISMLY